MAGPAGAGPGPRARAAAAWSQLTGTGAAASIALALLAGICVFICIAAPRASLHYRTRALQRLLAATPAAESSLDTSLSYSDYEITLHRSLTPDDITTARTELTRNLHQTGLPLAPARTDWGGLTSGMLLTSHAAPSAFAGPYSPQVEILYRDALPAYSRLVSGHLPQATPGASSDVFQVVLTAPTAQRFSLRIGSRLTLADGIVVSVSGIIRPVAPSSSFWTIDPTAATPLTISTSGQEPPYWTGAVFISAGEQAALEKHIPDFSKVLLEWNFPLRLASITADQAAGLEHQVSAAVAGAGTLSASTDGVTTDVSISTGLTQDLANFVSADEALESLLSLLFVSLAVIGAVVVLLGAQLLTEHRDRELRLMRSRGASLGQIAWVALRGGAVVVVPAAVLAAAIGLAVTPGAGAPLTWDLAGLTGLVALAGPALIAVRRQAGARQPAGPAPARPGGTGPAGS